MGTINSRKAFHCVNHLELWNVLKKKGGGIKEHLIILMKSLYTDLETTVQTEDGEKTDPG